MKVKVEDFYCYCPKCGEDTGITLEDLECGSDTIDYCPNCGAKLDWGTAYKELENDQ